MYCPEVFIITKRKELAIKHKKLVDALDCEASIFSKLDEAIFQIKNIEPEIIIISDTIDDDLADFIKKIRVLTFNYRPVIIAISKSDEIDDKLNALEAGSDDFLNESIPSKEFKARINAHIRRHLENSINTTTNFIEPKITLKALRKLVRANLKKAVMLIKISKINYYREIYGEIAYEKVLQTLCAIINSTLQKEDITGHYSDSEFILITPTLKAEKIAKFLTFAFDSILERLYSEYDFKNNFMMISTDTREEKKIPLMKLNIAVIETGENKFESEKGALNLLFNVLKLCKNSKNSTFAIDRPKLYGEVSSVPVKNRVMVMESDSALNYLIEISLKMHGFEVLPCLNYKDFSDDFKDFEPNVLILDYGEENKKQGLNILEKIKDGDFTENGAAQGFWGDVKIIFSTTKLDKKNILEKGADVYLPKPYEINTLVEWVKKVLK